MSITPSTNGAYEKRVAYINAMYGFNKKTAKAENQDGEVLQEGAGEKEPDPEAIARTARVTYKALVSEGETLYNSCEYYRAIDAFTKAIELLPNLSEEDKADSAIYISRANCYIKIGDPKAALLDIQEVTNQNPKNPKAVLAKAEAFFSIGEFEFALVYFHSGLSIRKDMPEFKDGVTKCKHAIMDSINGVELFQPNPNFAGSRPRKALVEVQEPEQQSEVDEEDENYMRELAALLPVDVPPLTSTVGRHEFLGELRLDYEYLRELQEEVKTSLTIPESKNKEQDEEISKLVGDALNYLKRRGAFWSQQGGKDSQLTKNTTVKADPKKKKSATKKPHYEMSRIQQYENKFGGKKEEEDQAE